MKILVAIESSENAKQLAKTVLRWAGRAGYTLKVFIPDSNQLEDYVQAVRDVNHTWYLALPDDTVVVDDNPKEYALRNGYELILYLPDDLKKWNPNTTLEINVLCFAMDVGAARKQFSLAPKKFEQYKFSNNAIMRRV